MVLINDGVNTRVFEPSKYVPLRVYNYEITTIYIYMCIFGTRRIRLGINNYSMSKI